MYMNFPKLSSLIFLEKGIVFNTFFQDAKKWKDINAVQTIKMYVSDIIAEIHFFIARYKKMTLSRKVTYIHF